MVLRVKIPYLLKLDSCFCLSLRTGSFLFGCISSFFALHYVLEAYPGAKFTCCERNLINENGIFMISSLIELLTSGGPLLIGAYANKTGLLRLYIILNTVKMILLICSMIFWVNVAMFMYDAPLNDVARDRSHQHSSFIRETTISHVMVFMLVWFQTSVVRSYYDQLMQKTQLLKGSPIGV
ncbi:unnamed protein product [Bemisia tabaci]|uniref:Uncharacterized protein n=1 Tax=Bemisia tabaci TaxID=7038 RepID=A0A9P0ANT1_BEMTA|nr:unnamed protein product [Bemisia tabaci]